MTAKTASSGLVLASVVPLLACVLLALPWDWTGVVRYGTDAITRNDALPADARQPLATDAYTRSTVYFGSHGEQLEAWAYLPTIDESSAATPQPCVLMAHGLGGQKDFGLHLFADKIASAGFVTVAFDYRCFGGSSGEPRNWVSPKRHVEDWMAAIDALQPDGKLATSLGVSCSSLSLWGVSFSGGHVLVATAKTKARISAIVSQIPYLSGKAASRSGFRQQGVLGTLRLAALSVHDLVRARLGMPAAYVRMGGRPSSVALMHLSEAETARYYATHPPVKRGNWTPWVPARLVLEVAGYRPVEYLSEIKTPILFVAATQDALCPAPAIREAARGCANCKLLEFNVTHFDLYQGAAFVEIMDETINFFKAHSV